jgi:hypothetical protein
MSARGETALGLRERGRTYREIAATLGVSKERARQLVRFADRQRRQPAILGTPAKTVIYRVHRALWVDARRQMGCNGGRYCGHYPAHRPAPIPVEEAIDLAAMLSDADLRAVYGVGPIALAAYRAYQA